ncbi:MAG: hypothetical protein AB7S55_04790 [Thiomonas sp.]|jgi:hypothetical protein
MKLFRVFALFATRLSGVFFSALCVATTTMLGLPAAVAAPASNQAAAAEPLLMGFQFGLAAENQQSLHVIGQTLSELVGSSLNRKVIWTADFTLRAAQSTLGGKPYAFAFVKPPNLTASLLAKGWQLVVSGKDTLHFGTDLIAQPCPQQRGKILVGGSTMSILGLPPTMPQRCIDPAEVWTSASAVLLAPQAGSLVDQVAQKLWREHSPRLPAIVHVKTQNAVTGLMRDMHVAAIGVVTPVVSKQWLAEGGVLLQHQPMPMWAVLAAPDVPAETVSKVRAALLGPESAQANKALGLAGWEVGSPRAYADFLKWLNG